MLLAAAGKGFATLIEKGHPAEWVVFGGAVLLGWLVMPLLLRSGRALLTCLLAAGLFAAACGIESWCGRPLAAVVTCGLLAVGWLGAAVFFAVKGPRT